jgi:hypothetical protein
VPPQRRAALDEQRELLDTMIDLSDATPVDARMALVPDAQGLGVAAGATRGRGSR